MNHIDLSLMEQKRRKEIVLHVCSIMLNEMIVEAQSENSLMTSYRGYYLQVSFSEIHPLMMFCLAKALPEPLIEIRYDTLNELNLRSVFGSHAFNEEIGCYAYRSAHWLETEINAGRFFEMLDRCVEEAERGFCVLAA